MMSKYISLLILRYILWPFWLFLRLFIKEDIIIFNHLNQKGYGGHPKALSIELHNEIPDLKQYWLGHRQDCPEWLTVIRPTIFNRLYYHIKAKVWIDDVLKPQYYSKAKDQIYVQTWHGDRGFKKIYYQISNYPKNYFFIEEYHLDAITCGSLHSIKKYPTAFHTSAQLLDFGMPANDIFFNNTKEIKRKLRLKYGFDNKKICLIAPTFTTNKEIPEYLSIDEKKIIKDSLSSLHEHWTIIYKTHHNDPNKDALTFEINDEFELLIMADLLISDYSSIIGDFILQNKPCLIYRPGGREKDKRDTHNLIDESYFISANTFPSLITHIRNINNYNFAEINKRCLDQYGTFEKGHASHRVVEWLKSKL